MKRIKKEQVEQVENEEKITLNNRRFVMNNRTWAIVELSQEEMVEVIKKSNDEPGKGKYFGLTYFDRQTIFIDKDLHPQRKIATLLHELGHCYVGSYMTHLDKEYEEEDICDVIANSYEIIHGVMKQILE